MSNSNPKSSELKLMAEQMTKNKFYILLFMIIGVILFVLFYISYKIG